MLISAFKMEVVGELVWRRLSGMDGSEHFPSHPPVVESNSSRTFTERKQQQQQQKPARIFLPYLKKIYKVFRSKTLNEIVHFLFYYLI